MNFAHNTASQQTASIIIKETEETLDELGRFLDSRKNLSHRVIVKHVNNIRRFLLKFDGVVSPKTI